MPKQLNLPQIHPQLVARRWPDFNKFELDQVCQSVPQLRRGLQAKYGISADEAARQIQDAYTEITVPSFESTDDVDNNQTAGD